MPDDYLGVKFVERNHFVLWTFPVKEELSDERSRNLWNPILKLAGEVKDRSERDKGIGGCCLTKVLLVDHMEVVPNAK